MPELKVPLAQDQNGLIVSPESADKGSTYYCPGCGDILILRKGEKNKAHFAHRETDTCSYETIIHKLAKHQIAKSINIYAKTKNESPIIERKCPTCKSITEQTLPGKITFASVEKKLVSGFIADVAIEVDDDVVAVIEIKVTHAVSDKKKRDIGVSFIELDAESIIENPMRWRPLLDQFHPFRCGECDMAIKEYKEALINISKKSGIFIPRRTKGDGVEFRRFFFHLFVVMKSHATSSQNRYAGCLASYHMQGY